MLKTKKYLIALLILLGVVLLLPFLNVYGSANPVISIGNPTQKDTSSIKDYCNNVNSEIRSQFGYKSKNEGVAQFLTYSEKNKGTLSGSIYSGSVDITIDMSAYKNLGQLEKQKTMQIALSLVDKSNISRTNINKIYNGIADLDVSTSSLVRQLSNDVDADFADAYSMFKPFSGVVGTILGVLALTIFILLALTIIIDLAYINIPGVQLALSKTSKGEKPKLVSLEAYKAIQEAESNAGSEYVNPLSFYFKSKTKQFIALGICLLYLVSGKIFILIANIMDYFQGFLPQ